MSDSPTVFVANVPGVGEFTFAKRNLKLEIAAKVELRRLTQGVELDPFTTTFVVAVADLKVLIINGPDGWDAEGLDQMDPFTEETYASVLKVWEVLRDQEEPFRRAKSKVPQGGEGTGGELPPVVPADVQPGADGSSLPRGD